jgi:hypothetical protein
MTHVSQAHPAEEGELWYHRAATALLGHVGEGLGQVLLAEGELADGPDLGVRLEVLLNLRVEGTGLQGNDLGGGIGVVGYGRAAVGAEEAPDGLAGGALALPLLEGAVDGELVLGDNGDEGVGRAGLALAVVAVVVAGEEGSVDVSRVGDGLAETVSSERHVGRDERISALV